MQTGKKILAAMLIFVMIMSVVPVFASAETTPAVGAFPQGTFFVKDKEGMTFTNQEKWSSYWENNTSGGYKPKKPGC